MPRANDTAGSWDDAQRPPLKERLSRFLLKPPDPTKAPPPVAKRRSVEELEDANRYADDKERLFGLIAAPVGAAIGVLITGALISNDPSKLLKSGLPNSAHVNPSLYTELLWVLLALAVAMLAAAWFRKRLYLGCAAALYGLAVFNLHYWGFGVPYVLLGAWLLVRAYRAQRDLKEAQGIAPRYGRPGGGTARLASPNQSKRYTPPTSRRRRPGEGEKQAG